MKLILAGTPQFAADIFQPFIEDPSHEIVGVFTQPDRPSGRGYQLIPSPVKQLALKHDVDIYQPPLLDAADSCQLIADLDADLMVVVAYGQIIPASIIGIPRYGCINVHASLLPRWRGAAPIQRAIEQGDETTGICIMQIDEGLDTGAVLVRIDIPIDGNDTSLSLNQKLILIGIEGLQQVLKQFASGSVIATKQDDKLATYAHKIATREALIDWSLTAVEIDRKIRAFYPTPGAFSFIGRQRCKIGAARVVPIDWPQPVGTIIEQTAQQIVVQCGRQALAIERLQLPSKKMLDCADVLQGNANLFAVGCQFGNG